jgi:isopentenyl-diphosphate Delta-isomerase
VLVCCYMSQEELIQVVDPQTGEPTGRIVPRSQIYSDKLWCRATNIYVLNEEGQILCQRRALDKGNFPGLWATHFGGHVTVGESYRINAVKELEEEIGLKMPAFQLVPFRTSSLLNEEQNVRMWRRDFITIYNGKIEDLIPQPGEVEELQWFSIDEIMQKLNSTEEEFWQDNFVGVHDIREDYHCIRAVLTACLDIGIFGNPFMHLKNWEPIPKKD